MDLECILDETLCFFHVLFEHVFWLLDFCVCIDLGTLNPQNAAFASGKTDNCLKLPFLKQFEQVMISGFILAPFCYLYDFRELFRYLFFIRFMFYDLGH